MHQVEEENRVLFQKLFRKTQINMMEETVMARMTVPSVSGQEVTPTKSAKSQRDGFSPLRTPGYNK